MSDSGHCTSTDSRRCDRLESQVEQLETECDRLRTARSREFKRANDAQAQVDMLTLRIRELRKTLGDRLAKAKKGFERGGALGYEVQVNLLTWIVEALQETLEKLIPHQDTP